MALFMILIGMILGAVIALLPFCWQEFVEWLQVAVQAVKDKNPAAFLRGTKTFLKKVGKKFKEFAQHYSETKEGKWKRTTTIRDEEISVNEVPKEFRQEAAMANDGDVYDISRETNEKLELANKG